MFIYTFYNLGIVGRESPRAPFNSLTKERTVHSIATAQNAFQVKALARTTGPLQQSSD
jgi:hypothetical protein